MSDVFVSYARPDEARAERVAESLRTLGYRVWRDDELPAHRAYADVIEERLRSAKAVVVLWSAESAKSQWVRAEADAARSAGTLVQATLDGAIPPMPFNQIQCADLKEWNGDGGTPGWKKLSASIEALAGPGETPKEAPSGKRTRVSVCVLPFANRSGDAEQEYFSDGITEDITTDLSKVSALAVTARNTAFQFKGQSVDVGDIAKKLGVGHVLEGSVRKAGGRVRITAQLIDGATGDHVWAERYDRDLTDIFAIQDEISKAIVEALKVKLLPEEKKAIENRGTANAEAYNIYLMARQYWITGNWGDIGQIELVARICKRAIEIDPNYARAWGLLAIVQSILYFTFGKEDDDGLAAAERALSLDPNIAEAHVVKARHSYEAGRFNEANRALEQALALDPESWEVNREAARISYFQRRFEDAARYYEKAAASAETDFHSWGMLSSVYEALGDEPRVTHAAGMAVSNAERVLAQSPTNGAALSMGATGLAILGEKERFKEWIDRALLVDPDNLVMRFNFACGTALHLEDPEGALELLAPIFPKMNRSLFNAAAADPDLDSLREIPKFKAMVEEARNRLGLGAARPPATPVAT
jgi:adenylate cyclase